MAKLVFPSASAPYRGFVGEVRGWFSKIASYVEKSPSANQTVNEHIAVLAAVTGYVQALPNTQALVTNGQKISGVTGTGTFANITVNPTTKAITIALTAS